MTLSLARLVISIGLLGACAFAGDTGPKTGAVQGTVFTTDADGGRSVAPGAKVSLSGPTPSETSADAEGKFIFRALQPGSYILKSEASGMTATQVVDGRIWVDAPTTPSCGLRDDRHGILPSGPAAFISFTPTRRLARSGLPHRLTPSARSAFSEQPN